MKLLPKKAVCEMVGISRTQLDRWTHEERYAWVAFPKPIRVGFRVFYLKEEVEEWIEAQRAKRDRS